MQTKRIKSKIKENKSKSTEFFKQFPANKKADINQINNDVEYVDFLIKESNSLELIQFYFFYTKKKYKIKLK